MKRTQQETTKRSGKPGEARTIDAAQLTRVRGGDDLGITVQPPPPTSNFMSMQHNEMLVRL